jgi:hypothetical protein
MMHRAWIAVALLCVTVATSGCMTRQVRTPVYDENNVRVFLRQDTKGGKGVDQGFAHPVTIAPIRITNILSRIEVRKEDGDEEENLRQPAISTGVLYTIGSGVAAALAKADPSQAVVVMATERRKSLKVFTADYLTSLIVWVKDDRLYVFLGQLGEPMPTDPRDKPREPQLDVVESKKRVLASDGFTTMGERLVAVDWRSNVFSDLSAIRIKPGGSVVRRTILLEEAPDDAAGQPGPAPPPEGLSPEALRALADLEETRRSGQLSETDYQEQRRQILTGQPTPPAPAP